MAAIPGSRVLAFQSPPVGDDTAAIQAAVDALPIGGVLDGANRTHTVGTIRLKSAMTLQNFTFHTKATNIPLTAPVTIDGLKNPIENVTVRNVHVIGNRSQQTNLLSAEDGGRDGFRIVGRARNIWVIDCVAEYCGTDGIKIFSGDPLSGDDRRLNFENIFVIGCRFEWNRRQGASGDSMRNVFFIDCTFNHNGIDIEGGRSEGAKGSREQSGALYGAGVDIEGYGVGCGIDGLSFIRCTALGNARYGIQFWDIADPNAPGFVPRRNIRIESCHLDGGVSPANEHQALEFSLPAKNQGRAPMYENITIQNPDIAGTVVMNCVHQAEIAGGRIRSPFPGYWGNAHNTVGVRVFGVDTERKELIQR